MRLTDIARFDETYRTKSGIPLDFRFDEDTEEDNRGFVLHKLVAYIFDHQVGYLKVDYVDSKTAKRLLPEGIYSWYDSFQRSIFPYRRTPPYRFSELTTEQWQSFARQLPHSRSVPSFQSPQDGMDWLKNTYEKSSAFKEMRQKYNKFKKYHFNKPKVAFINTKQSTNTGNLNDFSRQGIGLALYIKIAHVLAEKGLLLYASTLQQDETTAAWSKMTTKGWTSRDDRGMYLDVSKIPDLDKTDLTESEEPIMIKQMSDNELYTYLEDTGYDFRAKPQKFKYLYLTQDELHFVAFIGSKAVGVSSVETNPRDEKELWVKHVSVDPEYNGRGVATALIEATFKYAVSTGQKRLSSSFTSQGQKLKSVVARFNAQYPEADPK